MAIQPTRAKHLKATMTGAQFKVLRLQMGLEVRDLAKLLACTETTIRNIEAPTYAQCPGRQLERMMEWLSDPVMRARAEARLRTQQR